ncbi:MAG: efflux RND transporter permease subunit [Actinomycetota bacterium]
MYRLTELSLKKASVTLLIAIGLVFGGIYAAARSGTELMPDVNFPMITVITPLPGGEPADVAGGVSVPLEAAVANVSGVQSLQSVSVQNLSIIIAQFGFGRDMRVAEQEISQKTSAASLPEGAQSPQVARININETMPVVSLSLSGNVDSAVLTSIAEQDLVPRIKAIEGVQAVDVIGSSSRRVEIQVDPARMRALGVSTSQIVGILRANNVSIPSGSVVSDGMVLPSRTVSQLSSLSEIENLVVGVAMGPGTQATGGASSGLVRLKDIAGVKVAAAASGGISRTNGRTSVGLSVTKAQGANTVQVAAEVRKVVREVRSGLTAGIQLETAMDSSTIITDSIAGLAREGIIGALVAVLVIWLFLMSFRSALVTAVSIPLSVVVALLALYVQGFTLNILTLGGLTIAVGRVVDDAIVVLENIFRHSREGEDINVAVVSGTREVGTAILGSTMTTIAVFLPLGFTSGVTGVMFRPFALTVTYALLASLIIALTVVPLLARSFLKRRGTPAAPVQGPSGQQTALQRAYIPTLRWALGHRAVTLVAAGLIFVGSFGLLPLIPTSFLPQVGPKEFQVTMMPGPGMSPADLPAKVGEVENVVAGLPDVDIYETTIGLGSDTGGMMAVQAAVLGQSLGGATIEVILRPEGDLKKIQELARKRLAGMTGVVASVGSSGSDSMNSQFQVFVTGPDLQTVQAAGAKVLKAIQGVKGVREAGAASLASVPEVAIEVGLTAVQVAQQIRDLTVTQTITQVRIDSGAPVDLVLKAVAGSTADLAAVRDLPLAVGVSASAATGAPQSTVPLSALASINRTMGPAEVGRYDQRPAATITGTVEGANTGVVNSDIRRATEKLALPDGVKVEFGGLLQQFQDSFNSLYVSIAVAILIVYVVMVVVMGSLLSPFVIMFSLPLASIGALAALAATRRSLGISALFGVLMLVGIVVSNGIVLIDLVNQYRRKGYSVHDALIEGGRLRMRPVLMTAVATIVAVFPVALGFTEGAIIATELATVVIGGLLTATLLTLVVVPVVYSVFHARAEKRQLAGQQAASG